MTTQTLTLPIILGGGTPAISSGNGGTSTEIAGVSTFITSDNVVVSGELTSLSAAQTEVGSSYIDVNASDIGPGVTASGGFAGMKIRRGAALPAYVVWNESAQSVQVGLSGSLRSVASVDSAATNGFLKWDGSKFVSTGTSYVNNLNQNVSTTSSPSFQDVTIGGALIVGSTHYNFPTTDGFPDTVLTTDGQGGLSWTTASGGGGGGGNGRYLVDQSGNTSITVQATSTDDDTIVMKAGGQTMATMTPTEITLKNTRVTGAFQLELKSVVSNIYSIQSTDTLVVYLGSSNGTITLPESEERPGRMLIIENLSNFVLTIVSPISDTVEGTPDPLTLDSKYSSLTVMSDGTGNWIIWA